MVRMSVIVMLNNKLIFMAMVILFFTGTVFAENPEAIKQVEFDLDGMKPGDRLTKEFLNKYCPSRLRDNETVECRQSLNLDGIDLSILYFFSNARLLAISINYPSSEYKSLIETYTRKFSQSPSSKEEPILLSTGVEYTNIKSSWNTTSGEFVVEKYGTNFNKGVAYLLSDGYENYKIKKAEEVKSGVMKKLFGDIY